MKVIGVAAMARTEQAPEDVAALDELVGELAEEARVQVLRGAAARVPMLGHADLEAVLQRRGQLEPGELARGELALRRGAEVEADDIDRVTERVLAQAVRAIARRTARVGAIVADPARRAAI